MSIKYRLVQKFNPAKPTEPKKYYANVVTRGDVSARSLAKEITEICTISPPDVIAVIEAFLQVVPRHLAQGEIVRFGDFGSFRLSISSEGAELAEDFNANFLRDVRINFRPGQILESAMSGIRFEKE